MDNQLNENHKQVKWYHFIFAFLSGVFLINTLPHFINGIIGHNFPTPFANPPGKGLSTPTLNILWALINFSFGYLFLTLGQVCRHRKFIFITFLIGCLLMAFYLASYFGNLFANNQ